MKTSITAFLIKHFIQLAAAAALAVVIDSTVALAGGDIGWWTAYLIAVFVVYGGVLILSLDDWDN